MHLIRVNKHLWLELLVFNIIIFQMLQNNVTKLYRWQKLLCFSTYIFLVRSHFMWMQWFDKFINVGKCQGNSGSFSLKQISNVICGFPDHPHFLLVSSSSSFMVISVFLSKAEGILHHIRRLERLNFQLGYPSLRDHPYINLTI